MCNLIGSNVLTFILSDSLKLSVLIPMSHRTHAMLNMPNVDIEFWFVGQDHVTQHWIIYMCIPYTWCMWNHLAGNRTLFSTYEFDLWKRSMCSTISGYKICICNRQIECERNEIAHEQKKNQIIFFRIYFSCFPCIIHRFVCCLATNPPDKKKIQQQPIYRLYSFVAHFIIFFCTFKCYPSTMHSLW